jgi:hypothetical protein
MALTVEEYCDVVSDGQMSSKRPEPSRFSAVIASVITRNQNAVGVKGISFAHLKLEIFSAGGIYFVPNASKACVRAIAVAPFIILCALRTVGEVQHTPTIANQR